MDMHKKMSMCLAACGTNAQAEARQSAARVVEVEEELREVLAALEQHKNTSAAKFKQLQSVLQDFQSPLLQF